MENYLLRVLIEAGLNLGLLIPFLMLAFLSSPAARKSAIKPVLLFTVLFTFDIAVIFLFKLVRFISDWGHMNWQGKLLELGWPLLLVALVPAFSASAVGLRLPENSRSWRTLLITCVLYAVIAMPLMLYFAKWDPDLAKKLPVYAYEGIMPGLGEEFVYRGVLLMLLNQAFGRPWKLAGIQFGWGFVIVTVMFGLLHGIDGTPGKVHIYWSAMIFPVLIGTVLAWLRERTGSVWPCVVFHNFVNLLNTLFS
jgi:uncharacterized protein